MRRTAVIAMGAAAGLVAMPAFAAESTQDSTRELDAPKHFDSQAKPRSNETLTERLDRTDGVIKPPETGPKIHEVPPPTGDTEMVIPPPPAGSNPPPEKK